MSYISANNDGIYNEYEKKIDKILENKTLDFLSKEANVGIFDVEDHFGPLYSQQLSVEFPEVAEDFRNRRYFRELISFIKVGKQDEFFSKELESNVTPNTVRYIYHACLISKYIKEKFADKQVDIVEMGGGYGGLSFWMRIFLPTIYKYTIIDLPAACRLQKTCMTTLGVDLKSISDPNLVQKENRPIFVISNYGYSEFNQHYQNLYKNTVISKADGGFMIWNNWSGIYLFTNLSMKIEPERPSFPNVPNKFIYF